MAAKPYGNIKYEEMFIGQVPPNQIQDKIDSDGWGDRVKVRIPNYHSPDTPDEKLPWAIVERPTSQGNASRGSTGLCGGEWVRGYFIDGIPVICTVLSRGTYENNVSLQEARQKKSTGFKNITRYNSFSPHSGQVLGGDKPKEPAQPTKQEFEEAKKSIAGPQTGVANESGQGIADITGDWKGGRDEITKTDYEKIINSNDPRVTDGVKSDAAAAALKSGVIDQSQWLKVTEGL